MYDFKHINENSEVDKMAESISVQDLQKLFKEKQNVAVLDVRRKSDMTQLRRR